MMRSGSEMRIGLHQKGCTIERLKVDILGVVGEDDLSSRRID